VYTPKHSSWLNQIEIVFGVIMRKVIRRGNFTSVEDLRTKLLAFILHSAIRPTRFPSNYLDIPNTSILSSSQTIFAQGRLIID